MINSEMTPINDYVCVIGSSNMDLNIYSKRLPNPGETVTGGTFKQFLGGKGANQAVASSRSGSPTVFIGKIGFDEFGNKMISQLETEGINIKHIFRDPNEPSGIAFIMIDDKGENMISVAPGANFRLNVKEIQEASEVIQQSKSLIVQMEIPIETILNIFEIASKGDVIKILNPAPLKPIPLELLKHVDILVPNYGELIKLHSLIELGLLPHNKDKILLKASEDISRLGVKTIITTLGSDGVFLYQQEDKKSIKLPALKVDAIDTVGAGDCFNGVLAGKIAQGEQIIDAVKYAISAASIAVTRKGAQNSMPYETEINERCGEYKKFLEES